MVLPERFFTYPRKPLHNTYPIEVNGGVYPPNSGLLQFSQITGIAHELAHIYLQETSAQDQEEVYKIGDAVKLDTNAALTSASNYGFFMGGEYSGLSSACVKDANGEKPSLLSAQLGPVRLTSLRHKRL